MTVVINYRPHASPGYVPRKALTVHNVERVEDAGPRAVRLRMMFSDFHPTHDHVVSVLVKPDAE